MKLANHLEKLNYFVLLTEYSSIKSAAKSLGISQSGLSKSLAKLEEVLGVKLIDRGIGGLTMTQEGQEVLSSARSMLNIAERLEVDLRRMRRTSAPKALRIGMYDSIAIYFGPALKNYLAEIYPELSIAITVADSSQLKSWLDANEVDVAIGVNMNHNRLAGQSYQTLFDDEYALYISAKEDRSQVGKALILNESLSDIEGKRIVDSYLEPLMRTKRLIHKASNIETIKQLTLGGLGIALLPCRVADPLIREKKLVQLKIRGIPMTFGSHAIGLLTTSSYAQKNKDFVQDLSRLGREWSGV